MDTIITAMRFACWKRILAPSTSPLMVDTRRIAHTDTVIHLFQILSPSLPLFVALQASPKESRTKFD